MENGGGGDESARSKNQKNFSSFKSQLSWKIPS